MGGLPLIEFVMRGFIHQMVVESSLTPVNLGNRIDHASNFRWMVRSLVLTLNFNVRCRRLPVFCGQNGEDGPHHARCDRRVREGDRPISAEEGPVLSQRRLLGGPCIGSRSVLRGVYPRGRCPMGLIGLSVRSAHWRGSYTFVAAATGSSSPIAFRGLR